eukprot:c9798_g1_i1.p1 GENE.c9798_g1_i1~~c9798_g1_i1.p1  ORF type:complete len:465 (+),score=108.71 c9798_g1_i1:123-1517(+)
MLSSSIFDEVKELAKLCGPIMATSLLTFLMYVVDLAMVGHIGNKALAAASLGINWTNLLYYPVLGALTAFDTLFSQAFGASDPFAYGKWLITGVACTVGFLAPCILLTFFTREVLVRVGIDPEIAEMAEGFSIRLAPGIPFLFAMHVLSKYLQCQHILSPLLWISLAANIMNAILDYVAIYVFGLGLNGAGLATSFSRMFQVALVAAYLCCSRRHRATWPHRASLSVHRRDVLTFCRLGVSGAAMVSLEAWSFQLSSIFAGTFGAIALGAHSAVFNAASFNFIAFFFPLAIATTIRVGNKIGANRPLEARLTARVSLAITFALTVLVSIVMISLRNVFPRIYTSDEDVVALASRLAVIAALFQIGDGVQCSSSATLRGVGKQSVASAINLVGYWVLGVPVGASLAFATDALGVAGLWWGYAVGLICTALFGTFFVLVKIKWTTLKAVEDKAELVSVVTLELGES